MGGLLKANHKCDLWIDNDNSETPTKPRVLFPDRVDGATHELLDAIDEGHEHEFFLFDGGLKKRVHRILLSSRINILCDVWLQCLPFIL